MHVLSSHFPNTKIPDKNLNFPSIFQNPPKKTTFSSRKIPAITQNNIKPIQTKEKTREQREIALVNHPFLSRQLRAVQRGLNSPSFERRAERNERKDGYR